MVVIYLILIIAVLIGVIRVIKEPCDNILDLIYQLFLLDILFDWLSNLLNLIADFFDREDKDITDL